MTKTATQVTRRPHNEQESSAIGHTHARFVARGHRCDHHHHYHDGEGDYIKMLMPIASFVSLHK